MAKSGQRLRDKIKTWLHHDDKTTLTDADNAAVQRVNHTAARRNAIIWWVIVGVAGSVWLLVSLLTSSSSTVPAIDEPLNFGAVITSDFSAKDSQSALQAQQRDLADQQESLDRLHRDIERLQRDNEQLNTTLASRLDDMQQTLRELQAGTNEPLHRESHHAMSAQSVLGTEEGAGASDGASVSTLAEPHVPVNPFGRALSVNPLTAQPAHPLNSVAGSMSMASMPTTGIQKLRFHRQSHTTNNLRRTIHNYVPAGSFVTAVLTGGADANAGVNGQGDTAPIMFRTLNDGFLPNGKQSKLKDCFVTAATYGEVSSSRGIVRTQRLSCIFADDQILDIPIQGTAFNFGRNGIRGTTVMRNGKIVQMAGVSGLFTGLGDTAQAMSQTTAVSPLGTTTTIDANDALLNLAGASAESVGSKLADYYIKMAEQYHPIIELNPGTIVNIVFLEGFDLDTSLAEASNRRGDASEATELATVETVHNPLIDQLPPSLRASAQSAFQRDVGSTNGVLR
jgi:conjugal transfer pilus assembly protein TraB